MISMLLCLLPFLAAEDCPTLLKDPKEAKAFAEARVKFIKNWDKLLTWALSAQYRAYIYEDPLQEKSFKVTGKDLFLFNDNYGYFSIQRPILGIVTKSERDIKATQCLLEALPSEIADKDQLEFAKYEVLTKVMAYRTLHKGMQVELPGPEGMTSYVVDEIIDLWRGMPAFGLLPKEKGVPILLYRGTDVNLTTEQSWASVVSDLDITGPGLSTFLRAQDKIHAWLQKVANKGTPALVAGYSLGGVFVLFTLIYESALINQEHSSIAFNAPGISLETLNKWNEIPEDQKPPHVLYVNQGDFVSQIGFLLPNTWEISFGEPMGVIASHVTFVSAQPTFTMSAVDVQAENAARNKSLSLK